MPRLLFRAAVGLAWLTLALAPLQAAAPPKLDALWPAGGQVGQRHEIQALGKFETWPVQVWCDRKDLKWSADTKNGQLVVEVPQDAPSGPCLVRLHLPDGASEARPFLIHKAPGVMEAGSIGTFQTAQKIESLPVVIHGRLERRGDTDFFAFPMQPGDDLHAELLGYGLGSPIDPFLSLYHPNGYEIAVASDSHNLDPVLQHQSQREGWHALQVFAIDHKASVNVSYAGSSTGIYVLQIEKNPSPRPRPKTDHQEAGEKESAAPPRQPSFSQLGTLSQPGEQDEIPVVFQKGETWRIRVQSRAHRWPVDPVLTVLKPDGGVLKEVDDSNKTPDAEYDLKASVDGIHKIRVEDRFLGGGTGHHYVVEVTKPEPDYEVKIAQDRWISKPGETLEWKLQLTRKDGHARELKLEVEGLPDGISVKPGTLPGKEKSWTLKLERKGPLQAFSGPVRCRIRDDQDLSHEVTYSFQTADSRGEYLIDETPWLWLSVLPDPTPKKEEPPARKEETATEKAEPAKED